MMPSYWCFIFGAILLFGTTIQAAKILAVFAFPGKSHVGAFTPLLEELARRGHEVTVITPFPKNKQLKNYNEIAIEDTFTSKDVHGVNFFKMKQLPFYAVLSVMKGFVLQNCHTILSSPNMQEFIHNPNLEFDLVIYEPFFTQCTYGLLHKFKAPSIQILPNTVAWNLDSVGNPSTISYIPSAVRDDENMDFCSRMLSFIFDSCVKAFNRFMVEPEMDSVMRKYFTGPNLPSVRELERNAAFIFYHTHPVITHPRPFTPNTIEVGGLHIKSTQELPKDLKKFLDEAPHGVIYFSLGSNARSADMPEEMRDAILKSFSKLKQRVLWKWEADNLPGQPQNVRLGKWLPQNDILAHPNVKLFITHGGLMSIQEATYFGVPLISIPVAADQKFNAESAKNKGLGIVLSMNNITEESLDWALHELLYQPRYHEAAKRISSIFQDQPQTPLDRAVFWVEYAIRHKGAKHLRSAALDLNFFQYYLLDVIAVLLAGSILSVFLFIHISKLIFGCLFSKSRRSSNKNVSDKKNK